MGAENEKKIQLIRWMLLPIFSIIGSIILAIIFGFILWLIMKSSDNYNPNSNYVLHLLPALSSLVLGWSYVYITIKMAPKAKVIVTIVMSTIFCLFMIFLLLIMLIFLEDMPDSITQLIIIAIFSLLAAITTTIRYKNKFQ